ncbi:hypothetical protein PT015_16255 [Candidatus Mycobacterium wuenschmannii]|uniref:PEP-CTERM sorting domain-containing protein n=1 Tax=Candidatus Mycobacterium wuenschmannii TaxID=3027808 RepID=A0ABY8VS33_9MYCO|nr:hypothetical protein [Candidatus Mycobacterium wuenschmannii]WIM86448.1 hypothetical protein PT015_16255 [Candidatus Mycobacterium wuenschmannii]
MSSAAIGALLATPAIALLGAAAASADASDLAHLGPIAFDGFTDTFTYDTSTNAFDNLLTGSSNLVPFELDTFYGAPGSGDSGVIFTIPLLYQGGFEEIGGKFTPIFTVNSADFVNFDQGVIELGGTPPPEIETISLFSAGGFDDLFSVNLTTFATDNYLEGSYNGLTFDLDFFSGAAGPDSSEWLFTIPSVVQIGFSDIGGDITPIFPLTVADFLNPDFGLSAIGGVPGL